jgi:hypothetical protein
MWPCHQTYASSAHAPLPCYSVTCATKCSSREPVVPQGPPAALQHLGESGNTTVLQCAMNRGTRLTPLNRPLQDLGMPPVRAMLPCHATE